MQKELIAYLNRQMTRTENQLKEALRKQKAIKDGDGKLTEHAGWDSGYLTGKLTTLENLRDKIEDLSK